LVCGVGGGGRPRRRWVGYAGYGLLATFA